MYMTYMSSQRATVQWAAEQLAHRGLPLPTPRLREYTKLLWPPVNRVQVGTQHERFYTEADLTRLETATILKGLGFSNKEVQAWFLAPNHDRLAARIKRTRVLVSRAHELLESLKATPPVAGSDAPSDAAAPSESIQGQPTTESPTPHGA